MARVVTGTAVLAARATVDDEVLTILPAQVGQVMVTLHGTPVPGLQVVRKVEYVAMSAEDFAALPHWQ